VSVPRAVAFDGDNRLVAMEELKGTSLKRALPEIDIETVMLAAGEMIATFHQTRGSIPETVSRHDELEEVQDAVKAIGKRLPALRPRLRACLAKCTDLEWTDLTPPALLHGSCKLEHMLIHEGELALLDLDGLRRGHPAYDIGEFLSSLYNLEAQGRISSPVRRQIGRCFLQGYAARTPWTISPVAVFWFLAERLIYKQAAKYVEHLHDDCESKVGLMLTLAESVLARCTGLAGQPLGSIWQRLP
jgi:aminoglycoside phosphotransferase (APT) family kinase protein